MVHASAEPFPALSRELRGPLGARFTRFAGAALAALTATEVALTVGNGVFHLAATPAALASWFAGAVVSYALSRWAWDRKGRPDLLHETVPFWAISAGVIVVLTLANKFGYLSAGWLHLSGARHVLWVDLVWLVANFGTFLLRFVIFHYVLFADRTQRAGRAGRAHRTPGADRAHGGEARRGPEVTAPRHAAPSERPAPRHAAAPGARAA